MNNTISYARSAVLMASALILFTACPDDSVDPPVTVDSLSLSTHDITFQYTKGNSQQVTVTSSASWSIAQTVSWLDVSSSKGDGNANVLTLTTKEENSQVGFSDYSDQLIIQAGSKRDTLNVIQKYKYDAGVWAKPLVSNYPSKVETSVLEMTYGYACQIDMSDKVSYCNYKLLTTDEWDAMKTDNDKIESTAKTWPRISDRGELIWTNSLKPATTYMLILVPWKSGAERGVINPVFVTTRKYDSAPSLQIEPQAVMATDPETAENTLCYKWTVNKGTNDEKYLVYARVAHDEFTTFTDAWGSSDPARNGIRLAYWLRDAYLSDQSGNRNPMLLVNNKAGEGGAHEWMWIDRKNNGDYELRADTKADQYLEIAVWGETNGTFSGLICDSVFRVQEGRIVGKEIKPDDPPTPSATIIVSEAPLSFTAEGGTKEITVTGSDQWTATIKTSDGSSWCTITPTTKQTGNGTITVTAQKNSTTALRTATITVKGVQTEKTFTINVTQAAFVETLPGGDDNITPKLSRKK